MPTGTLLLATDFSDGSRKAFDAGLRLALDLKAKVVLVHALDPPMPTTHLWDDRPTPTGLSATGESAEATRWANEARRAGLPVEVAVRPGHASKVILEETERSGAALVVIGLRGKGNRSLTGTVAAAVIQKSKVPVLVAPAARAAEAGQPPGTILVAVDFSAGSQAAFEAALRLAHNLKAALRILHVIPLSVTPLPEAAHTPASLARAEESAAAQGSLLASEAGRLGVPATVSVLVGPPERCILEDARAARAALVVVGTHGRGGLQKYFLGSVAKEVVQATDRPVLVVPNALRPAG